MSRRLVTLLTMAALIAWVVHGRADEASARGSAETGAITGLVVDLQGRPVVRAEVWGFAHQEKYGPTLSGGDGRFRLPALKADKPVTVWADSPGLARGRCEDVRIFSGKDRDIGRLTLLPGTRMRGRAVDARGKPITGASVKLEVYRFQLGHTVTSQGTEWRFYADNNGCFATPPLPAGNANFSFGASGKVRTFVQKKAEPGTAEINLGDVTLPDEMVVAGIVVDGESRPAPGVEVIPDYDWANSAKTDKSGRFTVHGVGKDIKILQLQSNDYFTPKPFDITPGRMDLKLTVIKAYEIHGTAVDAETGQPVPIETARLCMVRRDPEDGHVTLIG
jgi:hypothetical protein